MLLRHLPADSACAAALDEGRVPWNRVEQLLDELRRHMAALGGEKNPKPHPDRRASTTPRVDTPERIRALNIARQRARERRRLIDTGVIT